MSYTDNVDFQEESAPTGLSLGIVQADNKMAIWLMRRGIAKSQNQAHYILLGVVVGAVFVAVVGWFLINPGNQSGQAYKGPIIPINPHAAALPPTTSSFT